jgi:hypothetical protein
VGGPTTETDRRETSREIGAGAADDRPPRDFRSILFSDGERDLRADQPACFRDLNLDQVVAAVVARREQYALTAFFQTPLRTADEVAYRHEVFRDVEAESLRRDVAAFADEMRNVRAYLGLVGKQHFRLEKQRWLLDAALAYCAAINDLYAALRRIDLRSRGLRSFRDYLGAYVGSDQLGVVASEAGDVASGLAGVRYTARIKGGRVTVAAYDGEDDATAEVERTFARFRAGVAESHLITIPDSGSMGHVEAEIAERVARLFPDEFRALDEFCARHGDFLDSAIVRFDREVQFYLAYLEHVERLSTLPLAYPEIVSDWGGTLVEGGWDIALAGTARSGASPPVVANGFAFERRERVLVVTGPNQGGKTTFARMVGQLHYLASLGLPVPAARARLALAAEVCTVFGQREDISTLRGRLDDELVRLKAILDQASDRSLILLNEVFGSTSVADAVFLGGEILARIAKLGCAAVWVTFADELASFGEETVSMVAGVEPDDQTKRTFAITRRPADGRAYAWAIAEKYGISYDALKQRVTR